MTRHLAASIDLTGTSLIGGRHSRLGRVTFASVNPRTGETGGTAFHEATATEVREAAALAALAFQTWRTSAWSDRAALLRCGAAKLEAERESIVSVADAETGLGEVRLNGELDRTCAQLRAFADVVEEGSFVEAIISPSSPNAVPARPDIRRMLVPIGPVAIFTPSNFPLAFGVAGGDTAAALAAGCTIVVKGHPSHPATSELCARALNAAVTETDAPHGTVSLLQARSVDVSRALVTAPEIQAVAFTGSLGAGRALHDLAAARPQPIPVYAEMGSLNPCFIGPGALASRSGDIAEGLAGSITLGTGQFCTKPGLVFVPDDEGGRSFAKLLAARVGHRDVGVMLNAALHATLRGQLNRLLTLAGVECLTGASPEQSDGLAQRGVLLSTTLTTFLGEPALREEHFGPVAILVYCPSAEGMIDAAAQLGGSLAAAVHAEPSDHDWARRLTAVLTDRVGRIVWNGYPTGVAVSWGMQHGGPYPSSTCAAQTSVGATAIRRFLRPVAFQNTPEPLLPAALRDGNPLGIQRLVEGRWTREPIHPHP